MKLIAHRANIHGPNKEHENNPNQIDKCIELGYDVEIDLRYDELTGNMWLGHDEPQYPVTWYWLEQRVCNLWIHCKDFTTLNELASKKNEYNYFWHQEDDFTLTSKGFVWTFPGKEVGVKSVLVDLNGDNVDQECYGICSDYVGKLK